MKTGPIRFDNCTQHSMQKKPKKKREDPVQQVYEQKKLSSSGLTKPLRNRTHKHDSESLTFRKLLKFALFAFGTIYGSKQNRLIPAAYGEQMVGTVPFNPYNQTFIQPQNGNTAQLTNGDLLCILSDQDVLYRQRVAITGTDFSTIGPPLNSNNLAYPQVAHQPGGAYAVVGIDTNQLTAIQYYSASDQPIGAPFEIQYYGTTHCDPHVATLVNGDIVVVFSRLNNSYLMQYYARLRWTGTNWTYLHGPNYFQSGNANKPSVFPLLDGGYVLTADFIVNGYARPLKYVHDANNKLIVSGYIDTKNSGYQQTQAKGTQLTNGKYVIGWLVSRHANSNAISISFRIFDPLNNNTPLGPESSIPLSTENWGPEDWVLDLVSTNNGFIITATANTDQSSTDIFQQAFDLNGSNITEMDHAGNHLNGTRPFATKISTAPARWLINWVTKSPKAFFLRLFEFANGTITTNMRTTTSTKATSSTKTFSSSITLSSTKLTTPSTTTLSSTKLTTPSTNPSSSPKQSTSSAKITPKQYSTIAAGSFTFILGIVFASLGLLSIAILIFFIFWKQRKEKKKPENAHLYPINVPRILYTFDYEPDVIRKSFVKTKKKEKEKEREF